MISNHSIFIPEFFYPICTRIGTILISSQQISIYEFWPIIRLVSIIIGHLIHYRHIFFGIQHIRHLIYICPTYVSIIRYRNLSYLTLLRSNKDNTVGTARTVNCTRCSIFQHVNTFNIGRIQGVNIATGYTINNVNWSCISVSTSTTNINFKPITRLTGNGLNIYTRRLAL